MTTPQLGDFGLSTSGGKGAWLIRLGTFSRWNHACVVVQAEPLRIVEAVGDGARERDCGVNEFTWSRCQLTEPQRQNIAAKARECIGIPYDYRDIVAFVGKFLGRKTRLIKSWDHGDDKLICSELTAWCYREGGHEAADPKVAPGDVSPGDLGHHIVDCVHPEPEATHAPPVSWCASCPGGKTGESGVSVTPAP